MKYAAILCSSFCEDGFLYAGDDLLTLTYTTGEETLSLYCYLVLNFNKTIILRAYYMFLSYYDVTFSNELTSNDMYKIFN